MPTAAGTGPPTEGGPLDHPPLTSPTWRSRAGAGLIVAILAVVPGMGLYTAAFVLPPTYLFGIPVATRVLARSKGRRDIALRLIGAGTALGPAFILLLFVIKAVTVGFDPIDDLWPLLLIPVSVSGLAGALLAAVGTAGALWTPPKWHRRLAFSGPLLFVVSAALQVGFVLLTRP